MRRVELDEPVRGGAREAVGGLREGRVQRLVDRLRVVAVDRVRDRVRVGRDQHRMAGGRVRHRRIGAAVPAPAAAVAVHRRVEAEVELQVVRLLLRLEGHRHQERVRGGIGDVVGHDPVPPTRRGRRDTAAHSRSSVQRLDRVRGVAALNIGEGRTVGDDVAQRLDVRVVDRRVVDVAQHAARDREPDLRRRVARRPQAVLAGEVEMGKRAGRALWVGHRDSQDMRRGDVAEGDLRMVGRNRERDVRSARDTALAVVLRPILVDRHLRLIGARRKRSRLERVDPVAVRVLEPGTETARVPVARATELRLEAPCSNRDHRALVVGDPVALVVVVELDTGIRGQIERNVRPAQLRVQAVVLRPRVVQRRLVLIGPRRQRERPLPHIVVRVVGEMRHRARRIPVARAAGLRLERTGDRDGRRIRRVRRRRSGEQHQTHRGKSDQPGAKPVHLANPTRTPATNQAHLPLRRRVYDGNDLPNRHSSAWSHTG